MSNGTQWTDVPVETGWHDVPAAATLPGKVEAGATPATPTPQQQTQQPPLGQATATPVTPTPASAGTHGYGRSGLRLFQNGLTFLENTAGNFAESYGLPADIHQWTDAARQLVANPIPGDISGTMTIGRNLMLSILSAHAKAATAALQEAQGDPSIVGKIVHYGEYLESGIPIQGPSFVKAGKQAVAGDVSGAIGTTLGIGTQLFGPGIGENIGTALAKEREPIIGASNTAQLAKKLNDRVTIDAEQAKTRMGRFAATLGDVIGHHVKAMSLDDAMKAAEDGQAAIDVGKVQDAGLGGAKEYGLTEGSYPTYQAIMKLISDIPDSHILWEQAKEIRTKVGTMVASIKNLPEKAASNAVYVELTNQLKDRASEINRPANWSAYNTLTEQMKEWLKPGGIYDTLLKAKGSDFFEELRKVSNSTELKRFSEVMENFGMPKGFFDNLTQSHQGALAYLKSMEHGPSMKGRLQALAEHPVAAGGTMLAMYSALPGPARFVLSLLGAAKAADIMDRIGARADLERLGGAPPVSTPAAAAAKVPVDVPKEPQAAKPVTKGGSGESAASQEAISRKASEMKAGIQRVAIDTRTGKEKPLIGVDAIDYKPQPYEVTATKDAEGKYTILDKGEKANPATIDKLRKKPPK